MGRNYLRVRGEYTSNTSRSAGQEELPPRTRRIHALGTTSIQIVGTTSAYAENTALTGCFSTNSRNYLRVRGEYPGRQFPAPRCEELPPRTRRILLQIAQYFIKLGTTSAYAENTRPRHHIYPDCGNYLRVRGEY